MSNLLVRMHVTVQRARVTGEGCCVADEVLAGYERFYCSLVDEGFAMNPQSRTCGTPRNEVQSPPRALLKRLHLYQDDYLR